MHHKGTLLVSAALIWEHAHLRDVRDSREGRAGGGGEEGGGIWQQQEMPQCQGRVYADNSAKEPGWSAPSRR